MLCCAGCLHSCQDVDLIKFRRTWYITQLNRTFNEIKLNSYDLNIFVAGATNWEAKQNNLKHNLNLLCLVFHVVVYIKARMASSHTTTFMYLICVDRSIIRSVSLSRHHSPVNLFRSLLLYCVFSCAYHESTTSSKKS